MLAEAKREAERIVKEARERQDAADLRGGGHQAGRARRRGHHRGRPRPRARDPPRRRGLRRRDPQHARGQPLEVHRRRPARPRAPAGQGRAGRSGVGFAAEMAAKVEVLETDITTLEVDAIANAANTQLAHGGGVAGAISRAGGPAVQRESDRRAPIGLGAAVETTAGDMPARWVIHAATMELGGPTSADIIRRATASTLWKAEELGRAVAGARRVRDRRRRLPDGGGGRDRDRRGPPAPGLRQPPRAGRVRGARGGRAGRVRARGRRRRALTRGPDALLTGGAASWTG